MNTSDRYRIPAAVDEPLPALKRFAAVPSTEERCELCSLTIGSAHPHLLDREKRAIVCACDACAILFADRQDSRFLRIPSVVRVVRDLQMDELHWASLSLPIDLAFFFRGSDSRLHAMYPSPGGAVESSLPVEPLDELFCGSASIAAMAPEVQALLISRMSGEEASLIVPIDECYRLTGLIRSKWRGLSGGVDVRLALRSFFHGLRVRAGEIHA